MTFLLSLPPYGPARDAFLLDAIAAGRVDAPTWTRVSIGDVEIEVSSDYLTIDGEHVPMGAAVAQAAVDALDALLPTPAVVDAIERAAAIVPLPTWAPAPGQDRSAQISSTVLALCEQRTRTAFEARGIRQGQLVAGHRKDVVLAPSMPAGHVVIYGARWADGRRLQPLYAGHEAAYADYSHGVRAVRRRCRIAGEEALLDDVLRRPPLGPVAQLRYTPRTASMPPTATRPLLRRGAEGPAVRQAQELLVASGAAIDADGLFGPATESATKAFQRVRGLAVDGVIGEATWGALDRAASAIATADLVYPADVARALGLRAPLGERDIDRIFGALPWSPIPGDPSAIEVAASWRSSHLAIVRIPEMIGIPGAAASGSAMIDRRIADQFAALWSTWRTKGKLPLVRSYAGSVAFRRVRDGVLPSRHARGLAFDINVTWNPRGARGAPRGATGSVCDLLEDLPAHGFTTGGLYGVPDWMHVEAVEILS